MSSTSGTGDEGLVERNLDSLGTIHNALTSQLMGQLAMLNGEDGSLTPIGMAAHISFDLQAGLVKESLAALPTRIETVAELIHRHGLTLPIDTDFVSDMVEGISALPIDVDEPTDRRSLADDLFARARENLELRLAGEAVIEDFETRISTEISQERVIGIVLNPEKTQARLELPYVTDPKEFPVALGPEAVVAILGSELTDEDYSSISQTLTSLEGEAGQVMQDYEQAVEAWAVDFAVTGRNSEQLLVQRRRAANAVNSVFGFSSDTDVPLDAIFITVVRRHQLPGIPTPQPYTH